MLSLRRKKTDAAMSQEPPWHPNFRNFERLPDTKVVRTAFFINVGAIALTVMVALWFAFQEYQLRDLRLQIDAWQQEIDRNKPPSTRAVAQFKKFQEEASRIQEINTFVTARPAVSDLLVQLGQTLPANIAIDGLELRDTGLRLIASVRGAPELASGHASTYLAQLRANARLAEWFEQIELQSINRNQQTGRLVVEYLLKTKKEKGAKK